MTSLFTRSADNRACNPPGAGTKLEVSRGMSNRPGGLIGAAVGGAAGIFVGAIAAGMPRGFPVSSGGGGDPHAGKHFAQGFGATLALGTAIGFMVGSERWQRIHLDPPIVADGLNPLHQ